jgi:hypothetical protein
VSEPDRPLSENRPNSRIKKSRESTTTRTISDSPFHRSGREELAGRAVDKGRTRAVADPWTGTAEQKSIQKESPMRVKLATIATTLVCIGGAFGAVSAMAPAALAAKPDLCKTTCGESWGAIQHAEVYAKNHDLSSVVIENCTPNSEFGAQWVCWGYGTEVVLQEVFHFHVWISEYGYEQHWKID